MSASASRIPVYDNDPYMWFRAMHARGLLFHPEDNPADIIIDDPRAKGFGFVNHFNKAECAYINDVIAMIRKRWGDPCTYAYQLMVDLGEIAEGR